MCLKARDIGLILTPFLELLLTNDVTRAHPSGNGFPPIQPPSQSLPRHGERAMCAISNCRISIYASSHFNNADQWSTGTRRDIRAAGGIISRGLSCKTMLQYVTMWVVRDREHYGHVVNEIIIQAATVEYKMLKTKESGQIILGCDTGGEQWSHRPYFQALSEGIS